MYFIGEIYKNLFSVKTEKIAENLAENYMLCACI
jgi:hypothetical protein